MSPPPSPEPTLVPLQKLQSVMRAKWDAAGMTGQEAMHMVDAAVIAETDRLKREREPCVLPPATHGLWPTEDVRLQVGKGVLQDDRENYIYSFTLMLDGKTTEVSGTIIGWMPPLWREDGDEERHIDHYWCPGMYANGADVMRDVDYEDQVEAGVGLMYVRASTLVDAVDEIETAVRHMLHEREGYKPGLPPNLAHYAIKT